MALLAAGIPAGFAAITFTSGQIISVVSIRRRRRINAIIHLIEALDRILMKEGSPLLFRIWATPELQVVTLIMRLIITTPKRDFVIWNWLLENAKVMINSKGDARMELYGEIQAVLALWCRNRRKTRKYVQELRRQNNSLPK